MGAIEPNLHQLLHQTGLYLRSLLLVQVGLLYSLNNRQEHKNSLDVVTGVIQVFDFIVYALLDQRASLYFVPPYVSMNVDIIPEQLSEPFSISTPVGEFIIEEIDHHDYPLTINHKSTMYDVFDLDMVEFHVVPWYGLASWILCHS